MPTFSAQLRLQLLLALAPAALATSGCMTQTRCFEWDVADVCPEPAEARQYLPATASDCNSCNSGTLVSVDSEGQRHAEDPDAFGAFCEDPTPQADPEGGLCCYEVSYTRPAPSPGCVIGRPLMLDGAARTAPVAAAQETDTRAPTARTRWQDDAQPAVSALTADQRARLARAWARDGAYEHASVASFGRFALELMRFGAPPELLLAAQRAATDEIYHARGCFGLASAYRGGPLGPGPMALPDALPLHAELGDFLRATAIEGAIGETVAAVVAAEQLRLARDPAVRALLQTIARDEGQHAELAWRTLRWGLQQGGAAARGALEALFADLEAHLPHADDDIVIAPALAAHGLLDAPRRRAAIARAVRDVIRPAAAALLA